jgi:membrane-associated phospholipid phosphatase
VGVFFVAPDHAMEERLSAFDHKVFQWLRTRPAETRIPRSIVAYLELAYFLVYPLVPLGVVVLYRTGLRTEVDLYWVVVLSATYVCYGCTLMIQARPPRLLIGHERFPMAKTAIRAANRAILDRASIQAITCPSAHVASALAAGLVLVHFQTSIGLLFVWVALSIAAATIVGGYHYVADVLSAGMVAICVFAIVCFVA